MTIVKANKPKPFAAHALGGRKEDINEDGERLAGHHYQKEGLCQNSFTGLLLKLTFKLERRN